MHPDGMNPGFFQSYWDIVGEDVTTACLNYLNNRSLPEELNTTSIVLIPKKANPKKISDLRPIALCNVLNKIVSKAITNCLKAILPLAVSEYQSAFIPGRLITDNIMIAFVVCHHLKRKWQGKVGMSALKIDMSKACDRVEWTVLQNMMLNLDSMHVG